MTTIEGNVFRGRSMDDLSARAMLETFANLEAEEALQALMRLRSQVKELKLSPLQPRAIKMVEIALVEAREAQAALEQVVKYLRLAKEAIFVREV